jgi:uncharacterized membrane protein
MVCYGMGSLYGITGYGMMGFGNFGIFIGSLIAVITVLLLVLLIKEVGR